MTETKYSHLVKNLAFRKGFGGANARELSFMSGPEIANFEFNFLIGVYNTPGDWAPNRGAHNHTFDEILIFFGYDPEDMNYLGSDMSLALGQEYEVHRFSLPTVVPAPKGLAHCPLITEKVFKPFGHFHLALSAGYSGGQVKQEGVTDGRKYANYVKTLKAVKGPGGADIQQSVSLSGSELEGINLNFVMNLYNKSGRWSVPSHVHRYDEVLVFFGHNTDNLGYLGAEISIELGEEREKHTFSVPTAIAVPMGLPHFPVICHKIEKPYRMMQIGLSSQYLSRPL
ncbi:MAG TPA: hypothetical protein VLH15_04840 [Dehalococcoidales bacterium]|nr:hypothetical protein [Dehalococcoidales bacterium]